MNEHIDYRIISVAHCAPIAKKATRGVAFLPGRYRSRLQTT